MFVISKLVLAYLITVFIGMVVLTGLERDKTRLGGGEKLALGFAIGFGLIGFYMFYLGVLGITFNFWTALAIVWPFLVWALFLCRRGGVKKLIHLSRPTFWDNKSKWERALMLFLFALLIWKMFFIFFNIITDPAYFDDSVSIWNLKAKVYYCTGGIIWDAKHVDFLGGHNAHYPNGIVLFKAWAAIITGKWSETAVNLNTGIFYLVLGWIFYQLISNFLGSILSIALTYLLLSVPLLTFHSAFPHYDLAIGIYFFISMAYLFKFFRENKTTYFIISALILGVCISMKEEGLTYLAVTMAILISFQLVSGKNVKHIFILGCQYLLLSLVMNIPWFAVKIIYRLTTGLPKEYFKWEFHPEAFKYLLDYLFYSGNFNIFWLIFATTFLLGIKLLRKAEIKFIYLSTCLLLMAILAPFIVTPFFEWLRVGTTINRALLSCIPWLFVFIGVCLSYYLPKKQNFEDSTDQSIIG